jgi:hypothetical protein
MTQFNILKTSLNIILYDLIVNNKMKFVFYEYFVVLTSTHVTMFKCTIKDSEYFKVEKGKVKFDGRIV